MFEPVNKETFLKKLENELEDSVMVLLLPLIP